MVGNPGAGGAAIAGLTAQVRAAYDGAPESWAAGPEPAYAALARSMLTHAAIPVAGRRVLDVGAGTGVAGRAALAAGAREVVSADVAVGMLRRCGPALNPVAAEAAALPFRDACFGVVLAAFSLNHLGSLPAALAEARRVGPALVASTFAPGWAHPAKAAVDAVLTEAGYRPPAWYLTMKRQAEPQAGDPVQFRALAEAAGFGQVRSRPVDVPTGLSTPAELAAWRLGMAHIAPFVRSLDPLRRAGLRRAAEASVRGSEPLVIAMIVHSAS
jgi:SAM-dependent methyltransferase